MRVRALVLSFPESWWMAEMTRLSNAESSRLPGVVDGVFTPFSVGVLLSPSPDCRSGLRLLLTKVAFGLLPFVNWSRLPVDVALLMVAPALARFFFLSGALGVKSLLAPNDADRPICTGDPERPSSSPSEI